VLRRTPMIARCRTGNFPFIAASTLYFCTTLGKTAD
jgi:hypothetical protein